MKKRWMTMAESIAELARTNPAVAKAQAKLDDFLANGAPTDVCMCGHTRWWHTAEAHEKYQPPVSGGCAKDVPGDCHPREQCGCLSFKMESPRSSKP